LPLELSLQIYADEGHNIWQPEHQRDLIQQMVAWFDQYLPPKSGAQNQ